MSIEHFEVPWGNPSIYSSAVRHGDLIFTAGQLGIEEGKPTDFATQAEIALTRLIGAVQAAGGGLETILKINAFLASMERDFATYNETYKRIIAVEPKPARTSFQIGGFPGAILLEVEAIAFRKS